MARKPNRKKQPMGLPAGIEFIDDRWPLDRLKPFERNPREHSPEQVSKIARSMEAFGFTVPILVDPDGEVIAGHGRLLAAQLIGLPEAPVRIAKGLTDDQKRAYRITDNQLTLDGGWKSEDLAFEMRELEQNGFDLTLTGFEPVEVEGYLRGINGGADPEPQPQHSSFADRFGVSPFSVLNAREGWWQDRKRAWIALGIKSEIGRGATAVASQDRLNAFAGGKAKAAPGGALMPHDRAAAAKRAGNKP